MKSLLGRSIFVSVITAISIAGILPTVIYFSLPADQRRDSDFVEQAIPDWLPFQQHVNLGLDLQGGVRLVLDVSTQDAVENRLSRIGVEAGRWAEGENLPVDKAFVTKAQGHLRLQLKPDADLDQVRDAFKEEFRGLQQKRADYDKKTIDFGYDDDEIDTIQEAAIQQAIIVIRNRVDKWGTSEASVTKRGNSSVIVQLPGFSDTTKAKELIGKTAQLKFKMVDENFSGFDRLLGQLPESITAERGAGFLQLISEDREALIEVAEPLIPEGRELFFQREPIAGGKKFRYSTYVVEAATELTGEDIRNASVTTGDQLDPSPKVSLEMTGVGAKRFADVTGENVGRYMAILLDDNIESAPVIQQRIAGGQASISVGGGDYNQMYEEAKQLSLVLKSGSLPANITVMEERQVGSTLGPELANQGIRGILVGLGLVMLYILFYYRLPGLVACTALLLNAVFLLAVMASMGSALTLPGIAGFILTLGMAVDANVLINERIRQELREGKHAKKALENGFAKVFSTIVDANITTLIAAVVLVETNTSGPIQGFAVTLIIGLLVSMFTSLYVTRLLFDVVTRNMKSDEQMRKWLAGGRIETLSKQQPKKIFGFLTFGKPATAIAASLGLIVLASGSVSGLNFGVDFKGGTEVLMGFETPTEAETVRKTASSVDGIKNLVVQAIGSDQKQYALSFDTDLAAAQSGQGSAEVQADQQGAPGAEAASDQPMSPVIVIENLAKSLTASLPTEAAPAVLQSDFVGPKIGSELRTQGVLSVIYAIIGVLIYIAFRFDVRFAPGAIVKMLLDVLIMLGFYVFFWRTFDLTSVAAFLTVVGYSVNDTIVIYDRIRENLMTNGRRSLTENINTSLTETLTRTINTSVTTVSALIGILIFGSGQIWNFAMALCIGVLVATMTSTFVASSFVLWLENWKQAKTADSPAT